MCHPASPPAGKKAGTYAILPYQLTVNAGMCVCYPIIAGQALLGICTTLAGPGCSVSLSVWIVIFSSVHLLLALLPDISALKGINALGAATTVTFSLLATIGAALQGACLAPRSVHLVPGLNVCLQPANAVPSARAQLCTACSCQAAAGDEQ